MSGYVEECYKTFTAGAAIGRYIRVKLAAGVLQIAGAEEKGIGITETAVASGDKVTVRLWTCEGTMKMTCGGAVTSGALVYGAAAGKIDDVQNGNPVGTALEAGSGSASIIEVLPWPKALRVVGGEVTLDGSNPTPVTTGLDGIVSASAALKSSTAPGDDPSWLSVDYTAGTLNVYAWKNTGGTDPTLVASTNNSAVVSWTAVGY